MERIKIANKYIGNNEPTFIIVEMGVNHNGDINIAKKMIDVAVQCKIDAVKFQAFRAEEFIADRKETYRYKSQGKIITESMYKMFKRYEFSEKEFKELFNYCHKRKIICFATPQNVSDLKMLLRIGMPAVKVGSDDLTNLPLIKEYASYKLPVILSTGMANLGEIEDAVNEVYKTRNNNLILLHCVSSYPALADEVNLRRIQTLRQAFRVPVGFSDHTQGVIAALGAVCLGAKVIEKHFTLDKNMMGPDHWFSADPKELKELVESIRYLEKALGSSEVKPSLKEIKMRELARRSIVAARGIKKGEKLTHNMIEYKRPGIGLLPKFANFIMGRQAKVDIKKNELITFEKLK
jgi:N-acetylneuraminate synthase/N,N'-diacetyllegionaminate synthase